MTSISQTIFSGAFLVNEKLDVLIRKSLFVAMGPIYIKPALVLDNSLAIIWPMLTRFIDAYMRH